MNNDLISRAASLEDFEWLKANCNECSRGEIEEYIERIKRIPAVDAVPQWISVEERLPEPCEDVLCYEEGDGMEVMSGQWVREQYYEGYYKFYWMPLPEPPEVLEDE